MKVLLINGSPHQHGCTDAALQEVSAALRRHEIDTELCWIGAAPVAGCIACGHCAQTGTCVFDDGVNQVLARLDEYDGLIVGSPVYFAGPSGQICSFLDRLFHCGKRRMAGKMAACVVSCRRGGASAAFDRLNKYFTISHMPVVSSQYWNQVHGNTPEEVRQDAEGLQTMRSLGENMAWMLRAKEAAKVAGVPGPVYEPVTPTNFIR